MKPLSLFLALAVTSCASKPPKVVRIDSPAGRPLNRTESLSVRHSEKIKAYPLGRYADPNSRGIMHEAHTIYRVETTPGWNLSGRGKATGAAASSSSLDELSRNELIVELNRQRETTKAVMQSGESVSTKLGDLASTLQQNQQALAEQNAGIRKELQATRERLDTLERKAVEPAPEAAPKPDNDPW